MKINDMNCNALCDLGASVSVMPKSFYDMLDLKPLKECQLYVHLADSSKKKPLGRVNDVLIVVNNNQKSGPPTCAGTVFVVYNVEMIVFSKNLC